MCYERRRAEACGLVCPSRSAEAECVYLLLQYRVCVYYCSTYVCVYYYSTYYKAVREGGGGNNEGHLLREITSRGLCGLVCPSRTNERGGEGYREFTSASARSLS